jgi:hypothetical protein
MNGMIDAKAGSQRERLIHERRELERRELTQQKRCRGCPGRKLVGANRGRRLAG